MFINRENYALAQDLIAAGDWVIDVQVGSVLRRDGSAVPSLINTTGYRQLRFGHKGRRVMVLLHRVVWEAAHGTIPDGMQVNHIDGAKTRNGLNNLELLTAGDNVRHAYRLGLKTPLSGELSGTAILDADQAREVYRRRSSGESVGVLASEYGVSRDAINDIASGRRWASVTADLRAA